VSKQRNAPDAEQHRGDYKLNDSRCLHARCWPTIIQQTTALLLEHRWPDVSTEKTNERAPPYPAVVFKNHAG
jgi:hypothetical protein